MDDEDDSVGMKDEDISDMSDMSTPMTQDRRLMPPSTEVFDCATFRLSAVTLEEGKDWRDLLDCSSGIFMDRSFTTIVLC